MALITPQDLLDRDVGMPAVNPLNSAPLPHSRRHPTLLPHLPLLVSESEMCLEADVALHLHVKRLLISL
jgi:hypothetical protein